MSGPFENERAAIASVLPFYEGSGASEHDIGAELMADVLDAAGVEFGDYERVVIERIAAQGMATVAVVAGWVFRARQREE